MSKNSLLLFEWKAVIVEIFPYSKFTSFVRSIIPLNKFIVKSESAIGYIKSGVDGGSETYPNCCKIWC